MSILHEYQNFIPARRGQIGPSNNYSSMLSLPHIQNQIREQLSELCEACFAEQEWLEEGRCFDANAAQHPQIASGENDGSVADVSSE